MLGQVFPLLEHNCLVAAVELPLDSEARFVFLVVIVPESMVSCCTIGITITITTAAETTHNGSQVAVVIPTIRVRTP